MAGIAIQLISFDRQGSKSVPKFHAEALQRISQQYHTHKVAFISSCGAGKQGKSFILNFVLRSLQKQVEGEDDYLDWENPDQPLKGFEWTNREDKTTDGMWITTEPILMKNSKDEEVAVFLIDTQGIFDEYSTDEESNLILATCFLLSTTTLFSIKGELHEDKIAAIANVLESIRVKLPIFQLRGLMLLVKDWIVQQDYTHGEHGGSKYLTKRLAISPSHPHGPRHAREVFRDYAVNVNAFLLPYPGDKTVKPEFAGSLEEILPKFTKVLEAFLLSPNLLDLDTAKYTGAEALKIVEDIIQAVSASDIESPSVPEALSLEASSQESLLGPSTSSDINLNAGRSTEQLVESLVAKYTTQLKDAVSANDGIMELDAFNALHGQLRESVLADYLPDQSNSFKESRAGEDQLKRRINDFYVKTKSRIEKSRNNMESELDSTAAETLTDFVEQLKNVKWVWTDNNVSKNTSLKVKRIADEAVEQFLKCTASYKKDVVLPKEQRLKNLLKEAFDKYSEKEKHKVDEKHDAQFDFKKFELLKEYNDKMINFLPGAENPLDIHNKYVKSVLSTLEFARPCHSDQLKEAYMEEFQRLGQKIQNNEQDDWPMEIVAVSSQLTITELSDEQDLPQSAVTHCSEPAILNPMKILQDANSLYNNEMTKFLQNVRSEEELEAFAKTVQTKTTELIETQLPDQSTSQGIKLQFLSNSNRDYTDLKAANLTHIRQKRVFVLETLKNEFKAKLSADQLFKTQAELESHYSELSNDLIRKLYNDDLSRIISIEEAVVEMRTWMDKQFETILKKFQIQQKNYDVESQELRAELTSFYDDAMQKHFKNYPFTRPADFLKFNGILEKKAIDKFTKKFPDNHKKIREILNRLYQKYSEQNDMNTPGEPAIGIDLGTTYCCVAIYQHGKVDIIKNELGKSTIPSYVALLPSGELIGENAKLQAHENPQSTIFDAKRLIGRKFHDKEVRDDVKLWPFKVVDEGDDIPKIEANGRKFPPEVISAKILKHIKNLAERHLKGTTVRNAVITVPAYFGDGQRQATKDAAEIAGLKVLHIINEPTAAAFAYHLHRNSTEKQNVLVYDLGGGTFDVSVLSMTGGKIEVKAVGGDTHLGGEDFDQALVNFCVQKFHKQHRINLAEGKNSVNEIENIQASRILRRLRNECEKRKMDLSSATTTTVNVASIIRNMDLVIPISRGDFEQMNMVKFNQTITVVQKALLDARLRKEEIHEVVLVGGSTRIPKIQELLRTFFNGKELCKSVNADEAVAYGAAIQAAILNGTKEQKLQGISLQDVTPMSLGIKLFDGSLSIVIPRNNPVPAEITKNDYTTAIDNQTELTINIFEGEDKQRATNNNLLGSFLLKNIPRNRKGVEKISVTMKVNAEGILHVSAVCVSNNSSGNIVIDEHKGRLTNTQIEEERKYLEGE